MFLDIPTFFEIGLSPVFSLPELTGPENVNMYKNYIYDVYIIHFTYTIPYTNYLYTYITFISNNMDKETCI